MTLRAKLSEYRTPLAHAMENAGCRWTERSGLLLTLEAPGGEFGQGEAAPLPGYSDETLDSCRAALSELDADLLEMLDRTELPELSSHLSGLRSMPPAARFAFETALLDLRARRLGLPMFRVLGEVLALATEPRQLELVTLLGDSPETWSEQTERALFRGYAGVKAKVGRRGQFDQELRMLQRVRAALGSQGQLRLDANGSFTGATIDGCLAALATVHPEFVEEPVPRGAHWPVHPAVSVALDESLRGALKLTPALAEQHRLVASVLKLGPLGGFMEALRLAEQASAAGLSSVVSHTLEGPVATAAAAEFALALAHHRFAHGLAPHAGLFGWPCALPAAYRNARLEPHSRAGLGLVRCAVDERSGLPR